MPCWQTKKPGEPLDPSCPDTKRRPVPTEVEDPLRKPVPKEKEKELVPA